MSSEAIPIENASAGGGQVLRAGLALSAACGLAVQFRGFRKHAPGPGLRAGDLAAVRALQTLCDAEVQGDRPGSEDLLFRPGPVRGGQFRFDVGGDCPAMPVLQAAILPLMIGGDDAELTVTGGTHNPMAPCFEYVRDVYAPLASAMNLRAYFELVRAGFHPAGAGEVRMSISGADSPDDVEAILLHRRGELRYIEGLSAASSCLAHDVPERQSTQALGQLAKRGLRATIEQTHLDAASPGAVVFLRAVFTRTVAGVFALARPGCTPEQTADEAVEKLLAFLEGQGTVDLHAADQLLLPAALAREDSHYRVDRVTDHLLATAEVVTAVTGRNVEVVQEGEQAGCVYVDRLR